jgi:hypothetical protein
VLHFKSEKSLWHISLIPIRKIEVFGSDKTSVIWKKKKDVVVTAFGWDAKTS